MAFTDSFTDTAFTELSTRTGWTRTKDGAYAIEISPGGTSARCYPAGGGAGASVYICTDQASADHETQHRQKVFSSGFLSNFVCSRLVDESNFIAYRLGGTGAAGRRLTKNVAGTLTDLITSQGVDEEFIKVKCSGNTVTFWQGGTGGAPSWTQVGTDQTVSDHNTETSQGFVVSTSGSAEQWDDFEAGALASSSAALTGTATASITETDIVTGGKTIILTLTGDTWVAAGATFDAQRQNIINGIDSAQAEATGWDAEVKAKEVVGAVVRTSDTIVTVTLSASAAYNVTATETITATIPATAVSLAASIVASPTFTVDAVSSGGWLNRNYFWGNY